MAGLTRQEAEDFLFREAELLDSGQLEEWLELMCDDLTYRMPLRLTRERGNEEDASFDMQYFWDDRETLALRIQRLKTEFAWAEDPPSRTRHFVSNVRVRPTDHPSEFDVRSYILVYRHRGQEHEWISGERHDVLRRENGELKLARRTIFIDQTTLKANNLAIML